MLSFIFISKSSHDILSVKPKTKKNEKKIDILPLKQTISDVQLAHCIYQTT